jgi:hypothetical protein
MTRIAVLACLPVLHLGGPIAAQETMSRSERYRAEKCVGQYSCDEEGTGAAAWGRQATDAQRLSQLPEKSSGPPRLMFRRSMTSTL